MGFDVEAARKDGVSDDDILGHLTATRKFDVQGALKDGVSKEEIIQYLANTQTTPSNSNPNDKRGAPTGPPTLSVPGMAKGAMDLMEGVGSGVTSTIQGGYNLLRKGASAVGLGELPQSPEWLQKAAAPVQYDAQGNPIAPTGAFSVGRTGEQVGEFFVPAGAIGKIAKGAEELAGAGRIGGTLAKIGTQAAGDALASGGVTMLQTGGNTEQSASATMLAGAMSGAFNTVGTLLKFVPMDKLYLSKLNFPERFRGQRVEDIMDKAIKEGILISKGGADKISAIESLEKADRDTLISQHLGDLVDVDIVKGPIDHMIQDAKWLGKPQLANSIQRQFDNFLTARGAKSAIPPSTTTIPGPNPLATLTPAGMPRTVQVPGVSATPAKITVDDAIKAKDMFQQFAKTMYGKENLTKAASDKLIAAGLNEALGAISPAYKAANQDIQNSKLLKQAILKYIQSNPGTFFNPTNAVIAWYNAPLAIARGALASPYLRSVLAVYGTKVINRLPGAGQALGRVAASGAGALSPIPQSPNQEPQQ